MNFITQAICNIDPTGSAHPLRGNGAVKKVTLLATTNGQIIVDRFPVSGAQSVRGYVQCGQAITVHFLHSALDSALPLENPVALAVGASVGLPDGGATLIAVDLSTPTLTIKVDNAGGATSDFRLFLELVGK